MQFRKSILAILIFAILWHPPLQAQFSDVPEDSWFKDAVTNLYEMGLIEGYEVPDNFYREFRPHETVTRAEFLKLCMRVLLDKGERNALLDHGQPLQMPFPDVPVDTWYAPYVAFAKHCDLLGNVGTNFRPNEPITRGDAVEQVFLVMESNSGLKPIRPYPGFSDVPADALHIRATYMAGIIDGYSETHFKPFQFLNRAEAAAIINRAYQVTIYPHPLKLSLIAHTPENPFLDEIEVPDSRSVVGIRLNNPDQVDNFIRVKVSINSSDPIEGLDFFLRLDKPGFRVWPARNKNLSALIDGADEIQIQPVDFDLWVENISFGLTSLYLEARNSVTGDVVRSKRLKFESFKSMVVVLGGEGHDPGEFEPDNPSNCSDNGCGIFFLGWQLYQFGYDVRLYDEDLVFGEPFPGHRPAVGEAQGEGQVYEEVRDAITSRGVTVVSVVGYSHGGGAAFDLVQRLLEDEEEIFIPFTATIDAVSNAYYSADPTAQITAPCSQWHINFYQTECIGCAPQTLINVVGGPLLPCPGISTTIVQGNINDHLREGEEKSYHVTIDDNPRILAAIHLLLSERVPRTDSDYVVTSP